MTRNRTSRLAARICSSPDSPAALRESLLVRLQYGLDHGGAGVGRDAQRDPVADGGEVGPPDGEVAEPAADRATPSPCGPW